MSVIESLFVIDLQVQTPVMVDDYSTSVADWSQDPAATRSVRGWPAQEDRSEILGERASGEIAKWVCLLPKGDPITPLDRVVWTDDRGVVNTADVVGPPWAAVDAENGVESHVECTLRMVTG